MTDHRRARARRWRDAPGAGTIAARLRRLFARVAACRVGAVALEFAVGLPLFIALVYGLFEFARIAWTQNTLEYALEEAARFAIVNTDASTVEIQNVVTDSAAALDPARITVTVTFETVGGGDFVTVTGTYDFDLVVPMTVPTAGGGQIDFKPLKPDITGTARMAVVQ